MEYEALYGGAAGGGKSDALLCEALRQIDKKEYRALILRKTIPQLKELIDRSLSIYSAIDGAIYKTIEHTWVFPSGAKIQFGSMHHDNDKYQYQGRRFDYIAFDELTHFTKDEYFYMFSRNRPVCSGMRNYIRASANPGGIGHSWVKERFIDPAPPMTTIYSDVEILSPENKIITIKRDRIFVPSTIYDNVELMRNAPNYIASLAMLPSAEKKALLYGDWNSFQGQVFCEFKDDNLHYKDGINTHVIEPIAIDSDLPVYRVFDFGYTRPYAVGYFVINKDKRAYMISEIYGTSDGGNEGLKQSPTKIAEIIAEHEKSDIFKNRKIIGIADPSIFDESRGESVAQSMAKHPNYILFYKANNNRLSGKMQIHNRLRFIDGKPMIYFFHTCKHMIRTISSLVYSKINVEDVDTNMEDHMYDVLRYFLMEKPYYNEMSLESNTHIPIELI